MRLNNMVIITIVLLTMQIDASYATDLHHSAAWGKNKEIFTYLSRYPKSIDELRFNRTALYEAVENNKSDAVMLLLKRGANVNATGKVKYAPIFANMENMFIDTDDDYCILNTLLVAGVKLDVKNENGQTPLHIAIARKSMRLIEILVLSGANIEAKNDKGYTPLMMAVDQNNMREVKFLIEYGANVKNDKGVLLDLTKRNKNNEMFQYLSKLK